MITQSTKVNMQYAVMTAVDRKKIVHRSIVTSMEYLIYVFNMNTDMQNALYDSIRLQQQQ